MDSLDSFIEFIRDQIEDETFSLKINSDWGSDKTNYRVLIRHHLAEVDSSYFSRLQNAQLYDLNQRPQAIDGFISIAHCKNAGGFAYCRHPLGFDIEEVSRISDPILTRTSTETERLHAPHMKFLWVAKEAAFKALSDSATESILITDLICKNWLQTTDLQIWSYQVHSEKKLNINQNIGYVFSTPTLLLAIYFK